jgi:hypothetical protein
VLLVHERYRQRAGEDAVFDAELELLRGMGHPVDTLVVDNDAIPDDPGLGQKIRLGVETIWSRRGAGLVSRRLAARPVDVVHVHNTFPLLAVDLRRGPLVGAAVVQTIHNYRPICPAATLFRDGRPCEDCVGRAVAWPSVVHGCYRDSRVQTLPIAAMLATQRVTSRRNVDAFIALTKFAASKLAEAGCRPIESTSRRTSSRPTRARGPAAARVPVRRPARAGEGHRHDHRRGAAPRCRDRRPRRRRRTGGGPTAPRRRPIRLSDPQAALTDPPSSPNLPPVARSCSRRSGTRACR